MKKQFTYSIVRVFLCILLLSGASASWAQTCHRVYIHLISDYSYFRLKGTSGTHQNRINQTRQAMSNVLNAAIPVYRQLGVEFVVASRQVFTNEFTEPFRNITNKDQIISKLKTTFPATLGTGVRVTSPYTGERNVFVYDMYILFLNKKIGPGNMRGQVSKLGGLYSNEAFGFITQLAEKQMAAPIPGGGTYTVDNPRSDAQMVSTFVHEAAHLFGASHLGGCNPIHVMCTGDIDPTTTTFRGESIGAIQVMLQVLHKDLNCTLGSGARMAITDSYKDEVTMVEETGRVFVSPNPTTGITTVRFNQELKGRIKLDVYNTLGQVVKVIAPAEDFAEGHHEIPVDMSGHRTGLYVFELKTGNRSEKIRVSVER